MIEAAAILLLLGGDKLAVEGPPFLVFGEAADFRLTSPVEDAEPVWRIADAPGGAASFETEPGYAAGSFTVRGSKTLRLRSRGTVEGDVRLSVSMERGGKRVATCDFRVRVGPVLRMSARCRVVENARGGSRRPDLFTVAEERARLQAGVNLLLRPFGVEVALEAGRAVAAPDSWFDPKGRFHPVAEKYGEKARSATLQEMVRHDEPGALNVYLVRNCHWTVVEGRGLETTKVEHSLIGVGMKNGPVVLEDSFDAATLAHEIGHVFGLEDLTEKRDRVRLMYSIRREREDVRVSYEEMKIAREAVRRRLKASSSSRK